MRNLLIITMLAVVLWGCSKKEQFHLPKMEFIGTQIKAKSKDVGDTRIAGYMLSWREEELQTLTLNYKEYFHFAIEGDMITQKSATRIGEADETKTALDIFTGGEYDTYYYKIAYQDKDDLIAFMVNNKGRIEPGGLIVLNLKTGLAGSYLLGSDSCSVEPIRLVKIEMKE